jgi:hypothetical protein
MTEPQMGAAPKEAGLPQVLHGGFVSVPEAFAELPAGLRHVVNIWHQPAVRGGKLGLEYSTTAMLADVSDVDPALIDPKVIAADCDLLKRIASASYMELRQALQELQRGSEEGVQRAAQIVAKIGGTEEDFVKAGGGLSLIVVVAAVLSLARAALAVGPSKASKMPKPKTAGPPTP